MSQISAKKISLSIGVPVFNEERNISLIINDLLLQKNSNFVLAEIIIIASGCSGPTLAEIKKLRKKYPLVRLITEKKRTGKANAVNLFLHASKSNSLVLVSADLRIPKETLGLLVTPLYKDDIGMTGSHPIPMEQPDNFTGFLSCFFWELHHLTSLSRPKMGEMIAFKKIFKRISPLTSVDEANVEPLISAQGYKINYVPRAIVRNRGPSTVLEYILRKRHYHSGHLSIKSEVGYSVSTLSNFLILRSLVLWLKGGCKFSAKKKKASFQYLYWIILAVFLEIWGRFLGFLDYYLFNKSYTIWKPSLNK